MLMILSPAKTINMEKSNNTALYTEPKFLKEAGTLIRELRKYSPPEMEGLMKINNSLAEENFRRHIRWTEDHDFSIGKQCLLAYDGAVFQGIKAEDFNEEQLAFAQEHLRILSGLYGVLRPLDIIQPYRLEMLTKLKNKRGNDLYTFWRDKLTRYFKEELKKQKDDLIINLASKEYASAIAMNKINAKVIIPVFKDYKNGSLKNITIYAKRARGLMTRFVIENKILLAEDLKEFNLEGYCFNEYLSTELEFVFTRHK